MSQIPSDIATSAAQSPLAARDVAAEREARRAGDASAASNTARTVTEAGSTVETTDADVAVFSDAEGAGGQGRAFQEEQQGEDTPPPTSSEQPGITRGPDGQLHVDIQV